VLIPVLAPTLAAAALALLALGLRMLFRLARHGNAGRV
jgi:hypothetical protein